MQYADCWHFSHHVVDNNKHEIVTPHVLEKSHALLRTINLKCWYMNSLHSSSNRGCVRPCAICNIALESKLVRRIHRSHPRFLNFLLRSMSSTFMYTFYRWWLNWVRLNTFKRRWLTIWSCCYKDNDGNGNDFVNSNLWSWFFFWSFGTID